MPLNNEALERLSRKSSHAYKPREGVEINRASTLHAGRGGVGCLRSRTDSTPT